MHPITAQYLAADHMAELEAEARRLRLARQAATGSQRRSAAPSDGGLRPKLRRLLQLPAGA